MRYLPPVLPIPGSSGDAAVMTRRSLTRALPAALTVVILALTVLETAYSWLFLDWDTVVGVDLAIYQDAAARLLGGGSWYLDRQLGGPYALAMGDVFYPPTTVYLFAPFLVLPAVLWWAIPVAITAFAVARLRPRREVWPLMALCLLFPVTPLRIISGNPTLWVMAAVALGLVYRWPAALVLLKPSMAPFALIGIRSRGWWVTCAVIGIATLPVLADTLRYPSVILDSSGSLLYSLGDAPLAALPLAAWLGSARRASGRPVSPPPATGPSRATLPLRLSPSAARAWRRSGIPDA